MSGRKFPESRDRRLSGPIGIRVTEDEREWVVESARARGVGISTFLRWVINQGLTRHEREIY